MAEIIWAETALNDIDKIAEYIALDSAFYATQFVEKIFSAVNKSEELPQIGKSVPELPAYNYREILFKKYSIIYRVHSDVIYIVSIHHSSRLLQNNENFRDLLE